MNPYHILKVKPGADQKEVLQAAALALRERRFTAKEVAMAQRELLDPVARAFHLFMRTSHLKVSQKPLSGGPRAAPRPDELKRLSLFDEAP